MRYFLDTEFIEDGKTIDLVSIGIVAEDGREYYACNIEARLDLASSWVRNNVLPHLPQYGDKAWKNRTYIAKDVASFIYGPCPQIWAYYAYYDWVALCQLFGTMMNLPSYFPKFCMDLKQLSHHKGGPVHPPDPTDEHNALADARWNMELFRFLEPLPWVRV